MHDDLNLLKLMLEASLVVKLVVLTLIFSSVVSWAIAIFKQKQFKSVANDNKKFMKKFKTIKKIDETSLLLSDETNSTLFEVMSKCNEEFREMEKCHGREELKAHISQFSDQSLQRSIQVAINRSNLKLEKSLSTLASIGSITPFIGLFGTVWGIIDSFQGLSKGGGAIESVAPGIAEALVATAIGLGAAIPAVWFFNHFSSRVAEFNSEMESFGQELLNLTERSV